MLKFYSSLVFILIVNILGTDSSSSSTNSRQKRNDEEILVKWKHGKSKL